MSKTLKKEELDAITKEMGRVQNTFVHAHQIAELKGIDVSDVYEKEVLNPFWAHVGIPLDVYISSEEEDNTSEEQIAKFLERGWAKIKSTYYEVDHTVEGTLSSVDVLENDDIWSDADIHLWFVLEEGITTEYIIDNDYGNWGVDEDGLTELVLVMNELIKGNNKFLLHVEERNSNGHVRVDGIRKIEE